MISLKLVFEIKLRLKYRVVFISVLCISKVFIFDHLYMIHSILVLGYIDPPNSHFYFSFVLRRESVSKEKKIEERAREREREMEKTSSNEELQSVLEAIKSSDVSFFQSFQLQFQPSIFQILASYSLLYLHNL